MPILANTTGRSEPEKYNLGRGRLYLAQLGTDDLPDNNGWRFLGNAANFSVNVTEEVLKHMSTQSGLKKVDRKATLSIDLTGQFTLEEFNMDNLADFFRGSTGAAVTNTAIAGFAAHDMVTVASGGVKVGRWYDIFSSAGPLTGRAYDINAADVTLKYDATTPSTGTTATLNTDYEVDTKQGRILILSTGSISDGDGINVTLAAKAGAAQPEELKGLQASDVDGALKFISENANDSDAEAEWQFHRVKLEANGDLGMITDEWGGMPFQFTAEENETLGGTASPVVTMRAHANG